MPLTARCKECGYILYDGEFSTRVKTKGRFLYTAPSIPREIMKIHDGKCPKCKRKLEMPSLGDVIILAVPEFEFPFGGKKNEPR